jgi:hypothetical protein
MKKQDLLSILLTFFLGVVCGAYLYLVGYAPAVATLQVPTQATVDSLIIEAEACGGCRNTCPSFQVLADGSYRYLYSMAPDEPQEVRSGKIPFSVRRDLQKNLTAEALVMQSQSIAPQECASFTDGIDVRYTVTREGETYVLDSCGTQVDTTSPLWLSVRQIWSQLENDQN